MEKKDFLSKLNEKIEKIEKEEEVKKLILSLMNFSLILLLLSFIYFIPFAKEGLYPLPILNLGLSPLFGFIFFLILLLVLTRIKA